MNEMLHAIFIEDTADDVGLALRELRRAGFEVNWCRVQTAEQLHAALATRTCNIVFCDWRMPQFDAPSALAIVRARDALVPFLIVSGTVSEELAVDAMRAGASDFISKDKLTRLPTAVQRALREAAGNRERERLREKLLIAERMASVGTVAAGVAHEINNPLAAVIGSLDIALAQLAQAADSTTADGAPIRDSQALARQLDLAADPLRMARDASERVRHIVRDLRVFSRSPDDHRTSAVEVLPLLEVAVRMAWHEVRHRARLVKNLQPVPAVAGNENRLCQVFLNLLVNAAHAIADGNVDGNTIELVTRVAADGRVVVEVRDTGAGIAAHLRERVFDAFFTTKEAGMGTGLGLSICQRIVHDLGGEIELDSELGRGSTFRVLLRAVQSEPKPTAAPPGPAVERQRSGRVLIVDDEPAICAVLRQVLGGEHQVVTATRAQDALQRLLNDQPTYDVVFCDLMMPHMTGMDLYEQIAQRAPALLPRIVFMTGGAFTASAAAFLARIDNPQLEKPFDRATIRRAVQAVMA